MSVICLQANKCKSHKINGFKTLCFINSERTHSAVTEGNSASVSLSVFPQFMELEIWVEAKNKLGTIESERLRREAGYFGQLNVV